ncbi:hybrid sensor histidine kinase/response regulator [Geminicoccus roseus]|uniref:hybrid sensor histidine kinase/response regulator n=1 Tax=Geminicoccus roseus TaxID=404900 RepID=UPI0004035AFD|nr:hybrid sensor histidine kinase/response regulator [Geminicoccus roseus]
MAAAEPVPPAERPGLLARFRQRLASRPDTEHEQALIRIGFALAIALYILAASPTHADPARFLLLGLGISVVALVLAVLVLVHILVWPGVSVVRRVLGMLIDTGGVNAVMLAGGMTAAPFYPILLWIIFGHGFRYGRPYLFGSAAVSLVLFGLVVLLNPDWRQVPALDVAMILALVVLPAYVSVLLRKLEQAIRRAEAANQAKSRFLAVMSHEFRTPLNAVIGLSDLLRQDEADDDRREMVGTIRTAAGTILGLVDAVLDAAKIEAGRFVVVTKPFDLHALLGVLRGMLEPQAQARGLWLRLVLDPSVPPHLSGDVAALQQVLANLVANALKFTEQGGVTLRVARAALPDGRAGVGFVVEDTGIGIPPELQARIFESFTQAEDTTNRAYGGTGLGLTIAKELVELMGGRLTLASTVGEGARFGFVLPLAPAPAPTVASFPLHGTVVVLGRGDLAARARAAVEAAGAAAMAAGDLASAVRALRLGHGRKLLVLAEPLAEDLAELAQLVARRIEGSVDLVLVQPPERPVPDAALAALAAPDLERDLPVLVRAALAPHQALPDGRPAPVRAAHPARLLVAEDNLTNQQVARRILESAGHQVVVVGSGQEAVDRIAAEAFDLVLMDLNMPGMSGIEALKLLRFVEDELPPVLALTADVTEATVEECRQVGFAGHAVKPIDAPILLAQIDRLVENRVRPQPPASPPPAPASLRVVHPATSGQRAAPPRPAAPARPDLPARPAAPAEARPALALAPASEGRPALDRRKLDGLAALDHGDGFVEELIDTFVAEAGELIHAIERAVAEGDAAAMRDHAHALRSSAAHVGASALFDVLLGWRGLDDARLLARGPAEVQRLQLELERAATGLLAWQTEHAGRS